MSTSLYMLAPNAVANEQFICRSGNSYLSDASGIIASVVGQDVIDILSQGGVIISPKYDLAQFGGSTPGFATPMGVFTEEGNLYRNIGNPIAGNAADTTDDILGGIQLQAGAFDQLGRGLCLTAQGKTGATANNKQIKLWINSTMAGQTVTNGVISGGTVSGVGSGALLINTGTTTINAKGWCLSGNLFKYGAAGANTQYFQGSTILDTTHGGILAPSFLTLAENAAVNIVVTGASGTTGAANDVLLNFLEFNAMN